MSRRALGVPDEVPFVRLGPPPLLDGLGCPPPLPPANGIIVAVCDPDLGA